jgi:citrate lyase beta subunit
MPGDDRRKIEKAAQLAVDAIIMDLEDGVALTQKAEARLVTAEALATVDCGRSARLVRINPVGSTFWRDDLAAVLGARPDGVVVPKVESAEQVQMLAAHLAQAERDQGMSAGSIPLLALIETALGVVNLREIASADDRLAALIFGAEDLAGDLGAVRTAAGDEISHARAAVVLHAKAWRLAAIDTPYVDLHDLDGLREQTLTAMRWGYTGKLAIHPRQVEVIQSVFIPSEDDIRRARALIAAYESHQRSGAGVFAWEGKMIDMPMIRAAEYILGRARAAGINLDSV